MDYTLSVAIYSPEFNFKTLSAISLFIIITIIHTNLPPAGQDESDDSEEEGDWITPDNIGNIARGLPLNYDPARHDAPEDSDGEESTVCCITADFAMQVTRGTE